ncbi:hypothetical protein [Corynebacterium glyciniphilum]|nr:hypothetical protein [Corynebacterium glyciniphilum]
MSGFELWNLIELLGAGAIGGGAAYWGGKKSGEVTRKATNETQSYAMHYETQKRVVEIYDSVSALRTRNSEYSEIDPGEITRCIQNTRAVKALTLVETVENKCDDIITSLNSVKETITSPALCSAMGHFAAAEDPLTIAEDSVLDLVAWFKKEFQAQLSDEH